MAKWNEKAQNWDYEAGELEAQVAAALATETGAGGPEGLHIRYLSSRAAFRVDVSNGSTFTFPARLIEGLQGRSAEELRDVSILSNGDTIEWGQLDIHLSLAGLMEGTFGSAAWSGRLAAAARKAAAAKGGMVRSEAKKKAAQLNGLGGGRPAKTKATPAKKTRV